MSSLTWKLVKYALFAMGLATMLIMSFAFATADLPDEARGIEAAQMKALIEILEHNGYKITRVQSDSSLASRVRRSIAAETYPLKVQGNGINLVIDNNCRLDCQIISGK